MSTHAYAGGPLIAGIKELGGSWGWFLALGIVLMLLGAVCIVGDITATFATMLVFGWFLLLSGIAELVHAFFVRASGGFFLYLLGALMRAFAGYVLLSFPLAGAAGLTLILASFFIVSGAFRAIGAVSMRFPQWGWTAFAGVLAVVLGIRLLSELPVSSIWFIGFAVGVNLLMDGGSLVAFAMGLHRLNKVAEKLV